MDRLFVVPPPFRETLPWDPDSLAPLGAIALCQVADSERIPTLPDLLPHLPLHVPMAVSTPRHLLPALTATLLEHLTLPSDQVAVIHPDAGGLKPRHILSAIAGRPTPTSALLARLVAQLLGRPDLSQLIAAGMSRSKEIKERTLRWQIRQELNCTPSDLHRLGRLATSRRPERTVDTLAFEMGTTRTRLRERVTRGLGVTLRQYNSMPGWEWVPEAAVRQGLGAGGWGLGEGSRAS